MMVCYSTKYQQNECQDIAEILLILSLSTNQSTKWITTSCLKLLNTKKAVSYEDGYPCPGSRQELKYGRFKLVHSIMKRSIQMSNLIKIYIQLWNG